MSTERKESKENNETKENNNHNHNEAQVTIGPNVEKIIAEIMIPAPDLEVSSTEFEWLIVVWEPCG